MKIFAALLLFLISAFGVIATDFDLGTNGIVSITPPENWTVRGKAVAQPGGKLLGFTLDIKPSSNATAHTLVTFAYGNPPKMDQAQLRAKVLEVCEKFVAESVEKKKNLKDFTIKGGLGAYCVFTDASLVGKQPDPGDYKVMGSGMVQFSSGLVGAVTLYADDANGKEFKAMLEAINSMRLKAKEAK
jgi:hypothetical protein